MNRKKQRCPYCGKRMSYYSAFFSRRKAEYVCTRCGKESRVVISKVIIPIFIIAAVISLSIMGVWFWMKYISNPWGILLVAAPLLIFLAVSPKFVQLEALKKYRKSMEAKKAGIEFSDNLAALEIDSEIGSNAENTGSFHINADVFNQIKASRTSPVKQEESDEIVSDSQTVNKSEYVSVTGNVKTDHAATTSYPLKKIHSEGSKVRTRHYLPAQEEEPQAAADEADSSGDDDVKEYKKSDGNKYSAHRRF